MRRRQRTISATIVSVLALCALLLHLATAQPNNSDNNNNNNNNNLETTTLSTSPVRFQGTAFQGLDEETMKLGGATITVQLLGTDLSFNATILAAHSSLREAVLQALVTRNDTMSPDGVTWTSCVMPALRASRITLSNGARLLKITFGAAPDCSIPQIVSHSVALPVVAVAGSSSVNELRSTAPDDSIRGPQIVLIPRTKASFRLAESEIIAGRLATLQVIAADLPNAPNFTVVEGATCRGAHAAAVDALIWDSMARQLRFRPLLGGVLSVCYTPFDGHPDIVVRAVGSLTVDGPEGLSTEPVFPRAQIEFTGMIFGTNLTDQDVLVISADANCNGVTGDTDNYDLVLSSPARALFWATVPTQGTYQVCYQRAGANTFVRVGSISLNKGSDLIVDKDMPQLLVDHHALVVRNTHISFLTLQSPGQLSIDNYQLNITHFVWTSGQLLGSGSVNCMGSNSKIAAIAETRPIESIIRNFGTMEIDMRHVVLGGRGSIYNYGDLTILVNSSGPEDPGTLQSTGRNNVLVNGVSGKITFRFLVSGGALRIGVPFENRGSVTVAPNGLVIVNDFTLASSGTVFTLHYSMLMIHGGKIYGKVATTMESEVRFSGDVVLRRADIAGQGTVSFLGGNPVLDSINSDSEVELVIDGSDSAPVRVSLFGTNMLGVGTRSLLRNAEFSATELSKLVFQGKLVCHAPSVVFGSNIVVQSNLAAVMFGVGEEEEAVRARLVPQRMPQNSSFVVPPNATLVIMSTGNLTQQNIDTLKSSPRVCAYYVVVPMHVEVGGRVLLWGCAMLPFGATVNGVIYGTNAKEIEATVEYAFCRNVLLNPRLCVPLFPSSSSTSALTGISVSGPLTVANTAKLPVNPSISLDYFSMEGASLFAQDPFTLLAFRRVDIDPASTFILTNGGLIGTSMLKLDGSLQVRGDLPLIIHGSLDVGPVGRITLNIDTSMCKVPLEVSEVAAFDPLSELRCFAGMNRSVGSAGLISFADIEGTPRLNAETCVVNGHEIATRITGDMDRLGLRFVDLNATPSKKARIWLSIVAVAAAVALVMVLCYMMDMSAVKMIDELRKECVLTLHLSWPEFSSFAANTVVVAGFLMEAMFFTMPAFHASLPLPLEVSYFIRSSMNFMFPHKNASAALLTAVSIVLISFWFMLWIPLSGKRMSQIVKSLMSNPDSSLQRKIIQMLFQSHTAFSFTFGLVLIPVLTHLLDAVACGTFLSDMSSCGDMGSLSSPAIIATVMLVILAPYSAHCLNFPFGHPPYNHNLDVRFKRSFDVLHMSIIFLEVFAWKVFASSPVALLVITTILVSSLGALVFFCRPCAYGNVNTMRCASLLIPLWALFTSFIQLIRFGNGSKFVCAEGDPLYIVLLFLGKGVLILVVVYSTRRCSATYDSLSNDPAIDASMKALTLTYYQIEDLRVEMYNTTRSSRREVISNNIARLRIMYLEKLRSFRAAKEKYLLPYYLGEAARSLATQEELSSTQQIPDGDDEMLALHPNSGFQIEDPVKPSHQFTSVTGSPLEFPGGTPPAAHPASAAQQHDVETGDWVLTADEMDRFHCGPQLGRGSYGTVHMGMLPSGRLVAVKVIQIVRKKKDQLSAVKLEVNMLRSLNHQNIIRYYGCHASQGYMRVFMEFAVGGSLTSLVRKFEKLSEPVMRYYTHQILSGLAYLHSRHVVHRDIKGENILIDGHGTAKLADFGCSKALADIANKSQNGCGTLVGSPYWMAPEVIKNEAYGTKADIWSVGCTVVEMLNGGLPPWHEKFDNVYSAMFFIANTTEIPSNIPQDVSDICRDFLARCFERDVTKRASAQELLVHPWLKDLPDAAGSNASSGSQPGSNNNTPKVERQWSDMFETDSNRNSCNSTQRDGTDSAVASASGTKVTSTLTREESAIV